MYSIFPQEKNVLDSYMFLGQNVNVARYDQQTYPVFEQLTEKQISFFWRPDEIDVSRDRIDYQGLPENEKHIFISNLKYQVLLDSIQGRSPNIALLPILSIPELEVFTTAWTFFESIHSRSYTHIIRNIVNDPSIVFDNIMDNEEIIKRAKPIAKYYDDLIEYANWYNLLGVGTHTVNGKQLVIDMKELKKRLFLCLVCINVLEAIRFYVSFACSFAFAERELMEGNAKIIKLIARDEAVHLSATQNMINLIKSGKDDPELGMIAHECEEEVIKIFQEAAEQEMAWCDYLFKDGSMIGLNREILTSYVKYITNLRMSAIGYEPLYPDYKSNPIPWINSWLSSDNVQVAPQEVEISSYLIGQIDGEINQDDLAGFDL